MRMFSFIFVTPLSCFLDKICGCQPLWIHGITHGTTNTNLIWFLTAIPQPFRKPVTYKIVPRFYLPLVHWWRKDPGNEVASVCSTNSATGRETERPVTCNFIQKETDTRLSQLNCNAIEGKQRQNTLFKEILTWKNKKKKTTNGKHSVE